MKITFEEWKNAQLVEIQHHTDLQHQAYIPACNIIAEYLNIDYKNDFKDKIIVEVGAGPKGSVLLTEGNFKEAYVVEPLIEKWPSEIRSSYEQIGVKIITQPYELFDIVYADETWLYNVLQHVISPEEMLLKAKNNSNTIRLFESLNAPTNEAHPHLIKKETITNILGDFGKIYTGGSRPNLHSYDCYYGTWNKT